MKCPRKNSGALKESLQFFFRCCWFACYFVSCLPGLLSQSCLQVPLPTERVVWTNNRALVRLRDRNGENPSSALVPFCSPEGKLLLLDKGSLQWWLLRKLGPLNGVGSPMTLSLCWGSRLGTWRVIITLKNTLTAMNNNDSVSVSLPEVRSSSRLVTGDSGCVTQAFSRSIIFRRLTDFLCLSQSR